MTPPTPHYNQTPQPYEMMRQVTRRATMRRSRKGSANKVPPNEKLEAIKRGQKLLDARLQVWSNLIREYMSATRNWVFCKRRYAN